MNLIDLLLVLLLLLGVVAGARAGFLGPVLGLAGGIAGLGLALALASALQDRLAEIEQPIRALVTLLGLGTLVIGGEALGAALGSVASHRLRRSWFRPFDAAGGAVVGAVHVVLVAWVLTGLLAAGLLPAMSEAARGSAAVSAINRTLPPPGAVAGRLLSLLNTTDLPPLFAGLEPPPAAPVEPPADAEVRLLAESGRASTARVTGSGCGAWLQVGSGFFVGPSHLVTNAHVVAGADTSSVTLGSTTYPADVVLFDPRADLAVLHVPDASAPALQLSVDEPQRGQAGAALGFPGGGDLQVSAAAITAVHHVQAPDIYGESRAERTVIEMRADVRRGNSGGPLLVAPGVVGGVVYGESKLYPDVGYAIAASQVAATIGPGLGSTQPVDTGPCG
ncbi:MAG TPA: MarP family serine protease [candidate division Zixibacteria bacterium]|nr:MarP family serine protease [candidate division Zixibacteria bacterium]